MLVKEFGNSHPKTTIDLISMSRAVNIISKSNLNLSPMFSCFWRGIPGQSGGPDLCAYRLGQKPNKGDPKDLAQVVVGLSRGFVKPGVGCPG